MKEQPLVSVIIPTYNQEKYIKKTLESVLSQTFKSIEIIVVDDGSTDETAEIVNSFNEPRIIYIWQKNKGPAAARNTGIKRAQGKYIAFLDADDLWLREKLERQINFMEKNSEIGLLGTGCYEINHKGEMMSKKIFPTKNKILKKILIRYNPFIQSSIMLKKEIFDKKEGYNESFPQSEDYELWLRIAKNYKIANLPEYLVMKRYYKESLSPTKDKEQLLFVLKAKKKAILNDQYPKWCYIYLLKSYLFLKTPFFLRKFVRKYLLRRKIYG